MACALVPTQRRSRAGPSIRGFLPGPVPAKRGRARGIIRSPHRGRRAAPEPRRSIGVEPRAGAGAGAPWTAIDLVDRLSVPARAEDLEATDLPRALAPSRACAGTGSSSSASLILRCAFPRMRGWRLGSDAAVPVGARLSARARGGQLAHEPPSHLMVFPRVRGYR